MINVGLALVLAAVVVALLGALGYRAASRSPSRSRYAALTIFGHGSLASGGILLGLTVLHVHGLWPFQLHAHPVAQAVADLLACDLEAGCTLVTAGLFTGLVLGAGFLTTQGSARLLLRGLRRATDPRATARLRTIVAPVPAVDLVVVRDHSPDAFSLAVLRADRRRGARAHSTVVVTTGLVELLAEAELRAAVAHELSHVRARDDRYLPFFRVLSSLLFFDPVLRVLHRRVSGRHEFAADREAVRSVRPRDLARALLKVYLFARSPAHTVGFGGCSRSEIVARIQKLLELEIALSRPAL